MIIFALGGNAPFDGKLPFQTVLAAFDALSARIDGEARLSPLYRTPAFPAGNGPDFANAVAVFEGGGDARGLLDIAHGVEAAFGRERPHRWAPRTLDVDLIAVDQQVLPDIATHGRWRDLALAQQMEETPQELILPHPRLAERAFVLVPMCDVAPDWCDPLTGADTRALLAALPCEMRDEVVPWEGVTAPCHRP